MLASSVRSIRLPLIVLILGFAGTLNATDNPPAFAVTHKICSVQRDGSTNELGYGSVGFANSCSAGVGPALNREIAKLHSFESNPRTFSLIAARDPECAVAWWGAAMSARGNPLGGSLDDPSLTLGRRMIDHALSIRHVTRREAGLIDAMDVYFRTYPDQITRARAYSGKMEALHADYPNDPDIAALTGLAIIEGVDLNDKTYSRQRQAGKILEAVMKAHPENPGAPHYLIHAYDYTALAPLAVHAAEIYPTIASASSHANHMPAHIWSMLGRWDRSIQANRRSEYLADPSSEHGKIKGDIVFEHAFDFIAYARLQKGEDLYVAQDLEALKSAPTIALARYYLERGDWSGAARTPVPNQDVFDQALARFTRAYGAARAGDTKLAGRELDALRALRKPVAERAGEYWGLFVDIYAKAAQAWILRAEGTSDKALDLVREAAVQDDGHEKHIYLENKILPMRESLADMELSVGRPALAMADYEASLGLAPNRYRSFLGTARAAEALGNDRLARAWWAKLQTLSRDGDHTRLSDVPRIAR